MASVTKTVDKTLVNGFEVFIYTINVSYSGLTQPAQNGKLVDFFPGKIITQLPQSGGQIQNITTSPTTGGYNVTFDFGAVNAGTSLSFTIACQFGPGRVDNDSFTNVAELFADGAIVGTATAPTVNLKLDENFTLTKIPNISAPVKPGQIITFQLLLQNADDAGAAIKNVAITDILPPELIPVTTFIPVGKEYGAGNFSDPTYNGRTGNWNGNTLNFTLPSYRGGGYGVTFQATVANNVTPGQTITNVGRWTMNGAVRNDAKTSFTVFKDTAGASFFKRAPAYGKIGDGIQYSVESVNTGTVTLNNYVIIDTPPPEVDIEKIVFASIPSVVSSYDLFIETSDAPTIYKTVASGLTGRSVVYNLTSLIPTGKRVLSVKAVLASVTNQNSLSTLLLYGTVNNTATDGQIITNKASLTADSTLGSVKYNTSANTTLNGKSVLSISKFINPLLNAYYPLNEFHIRLFSQSDKGMVFDPVFSDLLPLGLDYAPTNDYFLYDDALTNIAYDSRNSGFPIATPTAEVIKNYQGTGRTLVRFSFTNFTLQYLNSISVFFGVVVTLNPPNSFTNYGYLGNPGSNSLVNGTAYTDLLDLDGDTITTEQIAQSMPMSGTILTTSEFSLEKWVEGNLNVSPTKTGSATSGGDAVYTLNITNNQSIDLKNIELVDILPHIGDTGVILNTVARGSQFDVYATSQVTAEIVNVLGNPVNPNPIIKIEYSTSNNPIRFDQSGTGTIGTGSWSVSPPADITTLRSIRITTDPTVILKPYEKLIVTINAKVPVGTPVNAISYNSFAVRADKVSGGTVSKMNPAEPLKVSLNVLSTTLASIGDFVWEDLNGNGIFDTGEPGVNGIKVELYNTTGGIPIATTVTANNAAGNSGYYTFSNLPAGSYYMKFTPYGDYTLTVQQAAGSKPNQTTGITDTLILAENQNLTTIDAGVLGKKCAPPVISAINKCLYVGDVFNPLTGVTATDCNGKDITANIKVTANNVDTTKPGIYAVTYSITDSNGQTTTITIAIKVCEKGPHFQAITDLFESVALEQTALSHILNAEGEKMQKAIALKLPTNQILLINDSIKDMTNAIITLELILQSKLELFDCEACTTICCKNFLNK